MAEYSEQERIYQELAHGGQSICKTCYHRNVCRGVGNQPCIGCNQYKNAADVAEVAHGRWIHDINNLYGCFECMERETMSPKKMKSYCPNCGARMDGDDR